MNKKMVENPACCISFPCKTLCYVLTVFVSISSLLSLNELQSAEATGKVMILNSDMSITNYSLAHTAFKSRITDPKSEIDMGSKWTEESKIEGMIRNINPDAIYCIGSRAYLLAYKLAENKNLIFSSVVNWRRLPMGKNTYGISTELLPSMQLTMYRYLFPEVNKIGILYSKNYNKEWLEITIKSARDMGINVIGRSIGEPHEIKSALRELLPKIDALWLTPDPVVISDTESVTKIFKQSDTAGKPVFAYSETFVDFGATLIISADIPTIGKQAAELALGLLSSPVQGLQGQANQKNNERVQTPAGSHITLNLKKVEKYKIKLNVEALDSVNQIIK